MPKKDNGTKFENNQANIVLDQVVGTITELCNDLEEPYNETVAELIWKKLHDMSNCCGFKILKGGK